MLEVILDGAQWRVGEYSISGNDDDGFTVWRTDNGEDSETLYSGSFERCLTWIWNS